MIYTVKSLTHVQQNHSRESLLVLASQNGICGADKCCFCGERKEKGGCLFLNMPSVGSTQFFHTQQQQQQQGLFEL